MKRFFLVFSVVVLLNFSVINVHAQEATAIPATPFPTETPQKSPVDIANEDYKFQVNEYQKAKAQYLLSKDQYLSSKTLTAKSKLRDANYLFLVTRDNVVRTYLVLLNEKVKVVNGLDQSQKDTVTLRIQNEVDWYKNHSSLIPSAGTLEDLFRDSEKAKNQFTNVSIQLIYSSQVLIPQISLRNIFNRELEVTDRTNAKIAQIRQNQDMDTKAIERWILETKNKLTRAQEKKDAADTTIANPSNVNSEVNVNKVLDVMKDAIQYMKEGNDFLNEIVRKIKTVG